MRRYVYSAILILFVTACSATKVQAPMVTFVPTLGPTVILAPTFSDPVAPTLTSSPKAMAISTCTATIKTTLTVTPPATATPTRRPINTLLPKSLLTSTPPRRHQLRPIQQPLCLCQRYPLPHRHLLPRPLLRSSFFHRQGASL